VGGILIAMKFTKFPIDFADPMDIVFDSDTHFDSSPFINVYVQLIVFYEAGEV